MNGRLYQITDLYAMGHITPHEALRLLDTDFCMDPTHNPDFKSRDRSTWKERMVARFDCTHPDCVCLFVMTQ